MGSRGASSGGNTFNGLSDLEKAIGDNYNDKRSQDFFNAYDAESNYTKTLKNNIDRSISNDGYSSFTESMLDSERRITEKALNDLPKKKTPSQIGQEEAYKERLKVIDDLKKLKGTKASKQDIQIVV